jgi:hypothetical protein
LLHALGPLPLLYLPAGHSVHGIVPPVEYVPA